MRKSAGPWLLGGLLTMAGVGILYKIQNSGLTCQVRIGPGSRVMLVGDSLAVGLQTPMGQLARKTGCDFVAYSQSGSTMTRWIKDPTVTAALSSFNPTVVLVCLGTNDSLGNTPTDKLNAQIVSMRDWLQSTGATVVWILPPKLPFAERVSAGVAAAGIQTFPSANLPLPQPDKIHTTGRGYAGWAEYVWANLSCAATPTVALSGIGPAPKRPVVPGFMQAVKVPSVKKKRRSKKRRWV